MSEEIKCCEFMRVHPEIVDKVKEKCLVMKFCRTCQSFLRFLGRSGLPICGRLRLQTLTAISNSIRTLKG